MSADTTLDWDKAEERLKECERAYTSIGVAGTFVLLHVLQPVRTRFNSGERTRELYYAIMQIET